MFGTDLHAEVEFNSRRARIEERSRGPGEAFKPTWVKEDYIQESIQG
jgi:hypothetical protein